MAFEVFTLGKYPALFLAPGRSSHVLVTKDYVYVSDLRLQVNARFFNQLIPADVLSWGYYLHLIPSHPITVFQLLFGIVPALLPVLFPLLNFSLYK